MASYYYLIAGLPDIGFDDSKTAMTLEQFREEVFSRLRGADRKVMDLLLLEDTCRQLINDRDGFEPTDDMPQFIHDFIRELKDESWRDKAAFAEDRLWGLFYEYAMQTDNAFVRRWYEFNLDMNNILSAITARKYGLDMQKVIVGSNDTAQALRTSGARDWGLSQELDYFDDVVRLTDETDLAQRERKADIMRWNWLEENNFFNFFTVEKLFSFMVRLGMVERWTTLDKEKGQQLFRELIGTLKDQTEVPAEFR
jgi:hypothetical protein